MTYKQGDRVYVPREGTFGEVAGNVWYGVGETAVLWLVVELDDKSDWDGSPCRLFFRPHDLIFAITGPRADGGQPSDAEPAA